MTSYNIEEALQVLNLILKDKKNTKRLIHEFQKRIWENQSVDPLYKILSDLAYDLDFYEPDPIIRLDDISYFGEEKMLMEIELSINKINETKKALNRE